jgi:hypothetical protein
LIWETWGCGVVDHGCSFCGLGEQEQEQEHVGLPIHSNGVRFFGCSEPCTIKQNIVVVDQFKYFAVKMTWLTIPSKSQLVIPLLLSAARSKSKSPETQ